MIEASHYQSAAEAMVGPPLVPTVVSWLIIVLGSLEMAMALFSYKRSAQPSSSPEYDGHEPAHTVLSVPVIVRIVMTLGIGFAYVWLLSATGYIISTAIVLASLLLLFGTYGIGKITILTLAGTATYYLIFIRLMGVYDPTGWLINFT